MLIYATKKKERKNKSKIKLLLNSKLIRKESIYHDSSNEETVL